MLGQPRAGWQPQVHQSLIDELRAQVASQLAASGARLTGRERDQRVADLVGAALDAHARGRLAAGDMPLDPPVETVVAKAVRDALTGMGPLQPLLADPAITNIAINGGIVWVKRADGTKTRMPAITRDADELIALIRDIAARAGADERRFDRGVPRVSVRLPDGSRLFATMLSREPSISIRKHTLLRTNLDELAIDYGAMDAGLRDLLTAMVLARRNVIICGGTDTGKTTFLRAMAKAIPPQERLITIEDTDELALDEDPDHPDCVALQAREPNVEGEGGIDLAELVRWALRMSPDRVILGEARGGEVVPLLNCMSQGNDGSLATIHASSSKQAFTRLMTYAAQSAERLPFESTAPLIGGAVHFVVHLAWSTDGRRVVSSIREVVHAEGGEVISNEVFRPGPDRRAVPSAMLRSDTLDELVAAGFNPDTIRGW
ncbi:CpaF family protein [Actinoplanes sp. NEAU-A11]|uniref:CpaF family protein n=2 Tax=Actinoplanes aureus TaxID=2792083 RepID=A0A931CMB0_9ACTN|nr:ATPase, T2SS/T4P/T4SS family [Actinoplanes aureus]MBG0569006.1 CpaF family protein [Actinoplanes aureus]